MVKTQNAGSRNANSLPIRDQVDPLSKEQIELLSRGELALQAIRFRKQAAEYAAAASELEQAIQLAQGGNSELLQKWLEGRDSTVRTEWISPSVGSVTGTHLVSSVTPTEDVENSEPVRKSGIGESDERASTDRVTVGLKRAEQKEPDPNDATDAGKSLSLEESGRMSHAISTELPAQDRTLRSRSQPTGRKQDPTPKRPPERKAFQREDRKEQEHRPQKVDGKPSVRSIPSWMISVGMHLVLLVGLGVCTIKAIESPVVMAIQSAPMESDEVSLHLPVSDDEPELSHELESSIQSSESSNDLSSIDVASSTLSSSLSEVLSQSGIGNPIGSSLPNARDEVGRSSDVLGESVTSSAKASFFGVQAVGNTFCYIVDSSGSMRRDGAFDAAKGELIRSIMTLKPNQRFYIYFFSDEISALTINGETPEPFPVHATNENIQATKA